MSSVLARSHGWVITWVPSGRPGAARCIWNDRLYHSRGAAWDALLGESPRHRDAPTKAARKRRFEREGFRVHPGWLQATRHCQHGTLPEEDDGRGST